MNPRGIRNNNPGNIRSNGTPWQGLDNPDSDGAFARFKSPAWGIRALARTLITYQDKHGIDTVQGIIDRWAPPSENDTDSYADFVRVGVGVSKGRKINVHQYEVMLPMVRSIITYENGSMPYSDQEVDHGLTLAGIEVPKRGLSKSRTIAAAKVAGVSTALAPLTDMLDSVREFTPLVSQIAEYAPWALGGIALIAIGWIVWARIDDSRNGVR